MQGREGEREREDVWSSESLFSGVRKLFWKGGREGESAFFNNFFWLFLHWMRLCVCYGYNVIGAAGATVSNLRQIWRTLTFLYRTWILLSMCDFSKTYALIGAVNWGRGDWIRSLMASLSSTFVAFVSTLNKVHSVTRVAEWEECQSRTMTRINVERDFSSVHIQLNKARKLRRRSFMSSHLFPEVNESITSQRNLTLIHRLLLYVLTTRVSTVHKSSLVFTDFFMSRHDGINSSNSSHVFTVYFFTSRHEDINCLEEPTRIHKFLCVALQSGLEVGLNQQASPSGSLSLQGLDDK